jgi:hypothetical protein
MQPMSAGQRVFWRGERTWLDEHGIENDFNCQ